MQDALDTSALKSLVRRANKDYLYWDRFKYLDMPDGVSAEDAWRFLKVLRSFGRADTPVRDNHGHDFTYLLTEEIQRSLHVIDTQAAGSLTTEDVGIPTPERYLVSSLMEEAIASSQIEGASTTRRVAKDMLRSGRRPTNRPEQMIANNFRTVMELRELRDEPLTPGLLVQVQAWLTEDAIDNADDVGRLRETDDIYVHDGYANIVHVPPPARCLPEELNRLCQYANDDSGFVHPVIKAVTLHFWLAYLHPFADGNGRTSRALFLLFMLKKGYWLFEYVSISRAINKKRGQYDRAYLYAETDDCDLTYFLAYNLRAILTALDDLHRYLQLKVEEDRHLTAVLRHDHTLNHRQRALLARALKDPEAVFTVEGHRATEGVAYATARGDLLELADRDYLKKRKQGKAFVFVPSPKLRELLGQT